MSLSFYKDITALTIAGSPVEGVQYIRAIETFQKLELSNNGVVDGPVAMPQVGRSFIIEIASEDVALSLLGAGDCGLTIAWNATGVPCTIYGDGANHSYTSTRMVLMDDNNDFKTKAAALFVARFKQLSGGTFA